MKVSNLKLLPDETEGKLFFELGARHWNIPKLRELLADIVLNNTGFDNFEVELDLPGIGESILLLNARKIQRETGHIQMILLTIHDITKLRRIEKELSDKAREILEVSTPILQVWGKVVIAPLIGTLDSSRTQQLMDKLLNGIVETNSHVAIIDITGVPVIDTQTAQHLIETFTAVKLLGSQTILTGVRPAIAQTLVHLGINLSDIITRPTLSSGLKVAIECLNNGPAEITDILQLRNKQ